jgi:hypothetical protein
VASTKIKAEKFFSFESENKTFLPITVLRGLFFEK